jgi:lipid-A-disaccharide synthase
MRYYIIAGEASGDLHGSNLIKELRKRDSIAEMRCWGGDLMREAGGEIIKHYRDLAFMGFTEVISNLPTILGNLKFCKKDILSYQPDVILLIDYPGFNLRIAEWAKKNDFKIIYYISPQVWAWKENRVKKIKQYVDKMLVILPFEKEFYKKWEYDVEYVGHPLVEVIDTYKSENVATPLSDRPIIALLPGSRKQEILKKLPVMLKVSKHFPDYQFVVAKAPGQEDEFYEPMMKLYKNVSATRNETYRLLSQSAAALVTSGTATLETALFGVPEVVCYIGSPISYQIAKRIVKIKYISLVNLILDKLVVKELIQSELTTLNLVKELRKISDDQPYLENLRKDYQALRNLLQKGGKASSNAAEKIIEFLSLR